MTDIAELQLKIDSSNAELAAKVLDKLTASSAGTSSSAELMITAFKKLMLVLGPTAVAGAFANALKHAIDLQDSYVRLSEIAGTTASMMSAMDLPARLAGVSLDGVATSIGRLGKSIGEARLGDVQKQGLFRALGIDFKDGRDAAEVMVDVSKKVMGMKDQTVAAVVSQELLSRSFMEMRPFMKEIVEQGGLHKRVTDEEAAAAKRFNDQLTTLNYELQQGKVALANEYLPALTKVVDAMVRGQKEGGLLTAVIKGLQTIMTGDDAYKNNVRMVELTEQKLALEARIAMLQQQSKDRPALAPMNLVNISSAKRELTDVEAQLKTVVGYQRLLNGETNPSAPVGAAPAKVEKKKESEAERKVRELMEFNKTYEARVAAEKGFSERFGKEIDFSNAMEAEKRKQNLISDEDYIRKIGENENTKLLVMAQSLERQRELHEKKGEKGKASEAVEQVKQVNAAIVANEALTQAKITSLREVTQLEFRRGIAERAAAQTMELQDDFGRLDAWHAEQTNLNEIAHNIGLRDEEEYQARLAEIEARYGEQRTRMVDEQTKERYGIQQVYRKLDMDSARFMFGNLSALMNTKSRELFAIGKAAAIGGAIIDTYKAATGAYAALSSIPYVGPALGAAAAAAAIVAGMANVAQIKSQQFGGGSGATPTFPASPTTGLPAGSPTPDAKQSAGVQTTVLHLSGDSFSQSQIRELIDKINENSRDGGKIFIA